MSEHDKDVDAATGVETTGHEWDGIKELNNPLPRWWLYIFYITIVWAVVYWIFMPAWPALPGMGTNTPGIRNHSVHLAQIPQLSNKTLKGLLWHRHHRRHQQRVRQWISIE